MEGGGSFPVPLSLSWAGILYDDPVFAPLCVSEDSLRRKAVEALVARLLTWPLPMVCALSPALASLCIDCPFQDVRSALYTYFDSIYHSIGEGVPPDGRLEAGDEDVVALLRRAWSVVTAAPASPSKFIAIDKLVPFPPATLASEEGETFETCFLAEGHVSNLAKVLAWHPRYLKPLAQAQSVIMRDDGPLPVPWRHYVALCASSRHSCAVLARRCKAEFLR